MAFDDAARPEGNDLLEDGVDHRDEYYTEDGIPFLRNVGVPSGGDEKNDPDAGILKGTLAGDGYEAAMGLGKAFGGDGSMQDRYSAVKDAWSAGSAVVDAGKMGLAIAKGVPLAKFDPFNLLGSQLMSWMLEHVEPLRKTLDSLTGNPDMVKAYSDSWTKISEALDDCAKAWRDAVYSETADWLGATASAYRGRADELIGQVTEQAGLADVLSKVNEGLAGIVESVRTVVTDILTNLAGILAEITALLIASAGTATPALIARAVFGISTATMSVSQTLMEMADQIVGLQALMKQAMSVIGKATEIETTVATA